MRNKIPQVQEVWKSFSEFKEREMRLLDYRERLVVFLEMMWMIVPYILAIYFQTGVNTPRKHRNHRRIHRNI